MFFPGLIGFSIGLRAVVGHVPVENGGNYLTDDIVYDSEEEEPASSDLYMLPNFTDYVNSLSRVEQNIAVINEPGVVETNGCVSIFLSNASVLCDGGEVPVSSHTVPMSSDCNDGEVMMSTNAAAILFVSCNDDPANSTDEEYIPDSSCDDADDSGSSASIDDISDDEFMEITGQLPVDSNEQSLKPSGSAVGKHSVSGCSSKDEKQKAAEGDSVLQHSLEQQDSEQQMTVDDSAENNISVTTSNNKNGRKMTKRHSVIFVGYVKVNWPDTYDSNIAMKTRLMNLYERGTKIAETQCC